MARVSQRIVDPRKLELAAAIFDLDLARLRVLDEQSLSTALNSLVRNLGFIVEVGETSVGAFIGLALSDDGVVKYPAVALAWRPNDAVLATCCLLLQEDCDLFLDQHELDRFMPAPIVQQISGTAVASLVEVVCNARVQINANANKTLTSPQVQHPQIPNQKSISLSSLKKIPADSKLNHSSRSISPHTCGIDAMASSLFERERVLQSVRKFAAEQSRSFQDRMDAAGAAFANRARLADERLARAAARAREVQDRIDALVRASEARQRLLESSMHHAAQRLAAAHARAEATSKAMTDRLRLLESPFGQALERFQSDQARLDNIRRQFAFRQQLLDSPAFVQLERARRAIKKSGATSDASEN